MKQHLLVLVLALAVLAGCGGGENSAGVSSSSSAAKAVISKGETSDTSTTSTGTFVSTGSMSVPRTNFSATALPNGKVLVAGGQEPGHILDTAEIYDPTAGTFNVTGNMNIARANHQATLLQNGKILITGGTTVFQVAQNTVSAELYDPATNIFTIIPNMKSARAGHRAILLQNGKVLITGGTPNYPSVETAEIYDPESNNFIAINNMNTARRDHTMTLLKNGNVLIVGGFNDNHDNSSEIYDVTSGKFVMTTGQLEHARCSHRSVLLPSGNVLVIGGLCPDININTTSVELYDVNNDEFIKVGNLNQGRYESEATLLSSGQILVSSGIMTPDSRYASNTCEIYDPTSNTSVYTENLINGRALHKAVTISNGSVLIVGGSPGNDFYYEALSSAELFVPVKYTFGGFLPPISLNKPFKLGSTVPVMFQLFDAAGNYVTDAVATLTLRKFSGEEPVGEPIDALGTSGADTGNTFRFSENQYIYNLNTKALSTGTWQLQVHLDDGTVQTILIFLK